LEPVFEAKKGIAAQRRIKSGGQLFADERSSKAARRTEDILMKGKNGKGKKERRKEQRKE
jgi:hypothetical protein